MTRRNIIASTIVAVSLTFGAITVPLLTDSANAVEASAPQTLASGAWSKKSFNSSGTWSIYEEDGEAFVKLSADFKTRRAPDLKIFLSPLQASQTTGRNATTGSVMISPLKSNSGEQVYKIPSGVDLANFKSILIHCEAYSKLWSAADLS